MLSLTLNLTDEQEDAAAATGDSRAALDKGWKSMPTLLPSSGRDEGDDAPISMSGMASALKAAASNRHSHGSEDDGDWSD